MIREILKLPIALVVIFALIMFTVEFANINTKLNIPFQSLLAVIIFIIGIAIIAVGGYSFRKANTTVNPTQPENATRLVRTGIYRISRNPMYIGFFLWLLACAVFIGNVLNLFLLPVFVILVNKLYILPEEKALQKLFDSEFLNYKKQVRRWL